MDRVNEIFSNLKEKGKGPDEKILALSPDEFDLLQDLGTEQYMEQFNYLDWEGYRWGNVTLFIIAQLKPREWKWYHDWYQENK